MTQVTAASIAYIATQVLCWITWCHALWWKLLKVRFALSSSPVFSRTDTVTDSERFYTTVLDLFDDIDEMEEINELLTWWNRYELFFGWFFSSHIWQCYSQIFPSYSSAKRPVSKNSALARIKQKRAELRSIALNTSENPNFNAWSSLCTLTFAPWI
jgi:hypothetical protein